MAIREMTSQQILALVGQRHPITGLLTVPVGTQDYYDWLMQSLHLLSESSCGALRVAADDASAVSVRIMPGRATIDGTAVSFAGEVVDLAAFNNQTVSLWLAESGGAAQLGYDTDWPATVHLPLATVTIASGAISAIDDMRFQTLFNV